MFLNQWLPLYGFVANLIDREADLWTRLPSSRFSSFCFFVGQLIRRAQGVAEGRRTVTRRWAVKSDRRGFFGLLPSPLSSLLRSPSSFFTYFFLRLFPQLHQAFPSTVVVVVVVRCRPLPPVAAAFVLPPLFCHSGGGGGGDGRWATCVTCCWMLAGGMALGGGRC